MPKFDGALANDLRFVLAQPLAEALQRSPGKLARLVDGTPLAERLLEVVIILEHVAEIFRTREPEGAVGIRRNRVELDGRPHLLRQLGRHARAGDVLAGHAYVLAEVLAAFLEDAVGDLADVVGRHARHLRVADGERQRVRAVVVLPRSHAEHIEVVPVERREQEGGRHARLGEDVVDRALRVEVRALVLALQRGHPVVAQRDFLADVLERRPDEVLDACGLRRGRHILGLLLFAIDREVLPEIRDGKHAVRAGKRLLQALDVVGIALDDLAPLGGDRLRFVLVRVAGDGADGEATSRIVQDRLHKATALGAGRSDNSNDFLVSHGYFAPISLRTIAAPSVSAFSFIFATIRASGFMPQSVLSVIFSAGTCWRTFLMRLAMVSGVSMALVRMSSTPTCRLVSLGRFFMKSMPSMSRLA